MTTSYTTNHKGFQNSLVEQQLHYQNPAKCTELYKAKQAPPVLEIDYKV